MNEIRHAFQTYGKGKKDDTVTVWLNKEERELIDKAKLVLEQQKDSTAIKQLVYIGAKLLGRPEIAYILGIIFGNKRKNKRVGIIDFE